MRLPLTLTLLLPLLPSPALPDPLLFSTDSLTLRFEPRAGTLILELPAAAGSAPSRTAVPGIYLDGEHQRGFEPAGEPGRFTGESVDLTIERVAAGVLALEARVRDGSLRELTFRLRSDDQTAYYGTGERFQALNQRGYILPMRVDDRYGNKGVGTHKPVPFFMSSKGFGVWLDGSAPSRFDLSGSARFDTDLIVRDSSIRVVFLGGPRLATILERFTALTGRSPVPPPWAFGLWKSRDVHRNREEVLEDVELLRRHRIPASVLVIDSPWENGYNDFEINREQFADPESMFERIERLGFRLVLWLTPFVNQTSVIDMKGIDPKTSTFDEAVRRGALVRNADGSVALMDWWKGRGGLVDFTNPDAKEWWFSQLRKTLKWNARGFKCDDGEGNFVPDAIFHDGTPAALMKNRYSILYGAAMQEFVDRELGGDGVLITRSGWTGLQKFPIPWAGDNHADFSFEDGLPSVVVAGQNAAMTGIPLWGSDIAGYAGTPTKELFVRWTQFATFTPFMQVHMTSNLGPWDFDAEALEIFRRFAELRIRLFPYLYEAVHEAARSGMPVIRPMALAFEDDPEARRHIHQYLFGPDLLVAPMIRPGTSRSVYLPPGTWYDYWTREERRGPGTIEVAAPLDRIPLFVRAGAILPMLPDGIQTLVPRHSGMDPSVAAIDERRVLEVWPGTGGLRSVADSIEASMETAAEGSLFTITSERPRPLEIRFIGRQVAGPVEGGLVGGDGARGTTVVRFEKLAGARSIRLR
ncbi:MAG TPA: TIM-barrel domain-containing protein [Thermoanaerobaculia bacterium]|nr:TIM-barrel domain-containing protein [Thermoanaerobaculia bacterium]